MLKWIARFVYLHLLTNILRTVNALGGAANTHTLTHMHVWRTEGGTALLASRSGNQLWAVGQLCIQVLSKWMTDWVAAQIIEWLGWATHRRRRLMNNRTLCRETSDTATYKIPYIAAMPCKICATTHARLGEQQVLNLFNLNSWKFVSRKLKKKQQNWSKKYRTPESKTNLNGVRS